MARDLGALDWLVPHCTPHPDAAFWIDRRKKPAAEGRQERGVEGDIG